MTRLTRMAVLLTALFAVECYGASRDTVFPQFALGIGWSSEFFLTNQGLSKVSGIIISFYDERGASLSVDTNLGVASSFTVDLDPGATQVLTPIPSDTYVEGYVVVHYPWTGTPVRATEVFRYEQDGIVQVEVGVPQQEQGNHYSFPVEINSAQGIRTAVGFANPASFANSGQTLVVNLIRLDGGIQSTETVFLRSGRHLTGYLDESWLFPGLDSFTGSVSISSPFGVGILAIRQDKEAFGAISADGGPVLGPFAVSTTAQPEYEPNDTPEEAIFLTASTRISGTIGYVGDVDYFRFRGNRGDVVSVICDTQGTGSFLDSVLEILDGNSNQIAFNDQNGMAPQLFLVNDSFIQMVLPADDIYSIRVSDYFGDGSFSNYGYSLHVKLP